MNALLQHRSKRFSTAIAVLLLAAPITSTAKAFSGDPPDDTYPWAVHDLNRPQPEVVVPGNGYGEPPSDAIVLFDGTEASLENWMHAKDPEDREGDWVVIDGALVCVPGSGNLLSRASFGDCQLHIEWAAPVEIVGHGQGRGNSGVFLPGGIEVQVLDNYDNPSYADGMAGSVYGAMPPSVNALRAPGQWQRYEIIYRRPIVRDGVVLDEGSMTVLLNGVVVQAATPLDGGGGHKKRKPIDHPYPDFGPLVLQDHGDSVRFRNIWYRPLRPRVVDGGTNGRLSREASLAKRAKIAAQIRQDAATLSGLDRALRLFESQLYEQNKAAREEADQVLTAYLETLATLAPDELVKQKTPVLRLDRALTYLTRHDILPPSYFALSTVHTIARAQGWKE